MRPLDREADVAAIGELVDAAAGGRGDLLLVEGAPGLGKSTLLAEAERAGRRRGLTVLRARGHELERTFGWGVVRSLLEPALGGEVPVGPARIVFDPGDEPRSIGFPALHALDLLTARLAEPAALLLLVDDAHWADEPSLRYLAYLQGRLSDRPIAVVVATRPVDNELIEQLATGPAARVRCLGPLTTAAVAVLVRERLPAAGDAFCRRCWELTAGNPLGLHELLVAVGEEAAGDAALAAAAEVAARSLGRSVLRRLGTVSPAAQALARAVAVYEDDAPLHLAAALAGLAPEAALAAADELERADLLRAGDPLGFTHPLLRAAVYGRLPFGERARTHRRAAALLAESGATDERVAAHLLHSPPAGDDEVVAVLRAAARRSLAQGVPRSAVEYLDRALREPPPQPERAAVLAALARAEAVAGRPGSVSHLEAAIVLVDDAARRAALLLDLGRALHHAGRPEEAGAALERGLAEAAPGSEADLESAYLHAAMHSPSRAADAHRRGAAILADPRLETRTGREAAGTAMMMRLYAGAPRDEVLGIARRLDGAVRAGAGAADARTPPHVIGALIWCDDYRGAADALALTFEDARRRGSVRRFAMASQLRSRLQLSTGPVPAAVADARAAVEIWRAGRQMYLHAAAYCLVCALLDDGDTDAAAEALAAGDRQQPASPFFAAFRHCAAGRLAAERGEDDAALEAFLAAGRALTELLTVNPAVLPWRSEAGLAAERLGHRDQARTLIAEELGLARRFGAPRPIGVAAHAAALLEAGEAREAGLRTAAGALGACGARVEQARALVDLGVAIRRVGRPEPAREALRGALAAAEAVGAGALAARAGDELRAAGGRLRASAGSLTPGEHRVAALAAAGRTNREIAAELYLTVKSVEWHLGNTYRKLDIRGRSELPERLA